MNKIWKARWIWTREGDNNNENGPGGGYAQNCTYVYFRNRFHLTQAPASPIAHISADVFYKLYINGSYVGWGPARSDPAWMSYDTWAVKPYLRVGDNLVLVLVCRFVRSGGALFLQMENGDQALPASGVGKWEWKKADEWTEWAMHGSSWSFSERVDGRKRDNDVLAGSLKTDDWKSVVVLGANRHAMSNSSGGNEPPTPLQALASSPYVWPYLWLEPRDVPQLTTTLEKPKQVVKTGETSALKNPCQLDSGSEPVPSKKIGVELMTPTASATSFAFDCHEDGFVCRPLSSTISKAAVVILDFGRLLNGHLIIRLNAKAGAVVSLGYGQILTEKEGLYGEVMCQDPMLDHGDRYICREGEQEFETFHFKHFRYLKIQLDCVSSPVEVKQVFVRALWHPAPRKGKFQCSDTWLNTFFDLSEKNIRNILLDNIVDNNWRERQQYDMAMFIFSLLSVLGDIPNIRRHFLSVARRQHYTGFIPQHFPENFDHCRYGWSLGFAEELGVIIALGEYLYYGKDADVIIQLYPAVAKYLSWIKNYTGADGVLIDNPPLMRWVDWADHDFRGPSLIMNLWYYAALSYAAKMADCYGLKSHSDQYQKKKELLKNAIERCFYDPESGFFSDAIVDGKPSDVHTLLGQSLVVLYDIGTPGQKMGTVNSLLNWKKLNPVSPYLTLPVVRAFSRLGRIDQAVQFMHEFYNPMIQKNSDGLWELPYDAWMKVMSRHGDRVGQNGNISQAGSEAAVFFLFADILGIVPLEPQMKTVYIRPSPGALSKVEGTYESPQGPISVSAG